MLVCTSPNQVMEVQQHQLSLDVANPATDLSEQLSVINKALYY